MSKSGVVLSRKKCLPIEADSSIDPSDVVLAVGSEDKAQEALKSRARAPMAAGAAVLLLQV